MKTLKQLERNKNVWIMLTILFFFFLLRFPSLFEPYWYGDEGVYQAVAMAIKENKLLYKDIWDNKPPLIYVLYSAFNSDQFAMRTISLLFGILSVSVFFALAKKLFQNSKEKYAYLFPTIIFILLFGLPLIEGNIANAENFMLLPILLAAFLIFNLEYKPTRMFLAGLLLGIAFLFKVVALFDFAAFIIFIAIVYLHQKTKSINIQKLIRQIAFFPVGFALPILLTASFFLIKNAFKDFSEATFTQNISYVSYSNTPLFPQGLLLLKLILLSAFIFYIFKIRKTLSSTTIFILIWFAFSLFNAFFSGRPYAHYLLVLAPSFSLMLGLMLWDKKHRKVIFMILFVVLILIFNNFNFFPKYIAYYQNFIDFISNKKSVSKYQAFFDKQTQADYEVAQFLKSKINKGDSVFIWGNNPQLYKIIGVAPPTKYVTAYHTVSQKKNIETVIRSLQEIKPRFIVITSNHQTMPLSLLNYSTGIRIKNVVIYERVF